MNTLLFLFLVWFPLAVLVHATVADGVFKTVWKKLIFWGITLPYIWWVGVTKVVTKVASKVTILSKLKDWFLS